MMEGNEFVGSVKKFFGFLVNEFGFKLKKEKIVGNYYYLIIFDSCDYELTVYLENIENVYQVVLRKFEINESDNDLNNLYLSDICRKNHIELSKDKIMQNEIIFYQFVANNEMEKKIIKSAKEIRLYLKYV